MTDTQLIEYIQSVVKDYVNVIANGSIVRKVVKLSNEGLGIANNVDVVLTIPAGVSYSSHQTSWGLYNTGSDTWEIGTILPGQTAILTIDWSVDDITGLPYTIEHEINYSGAESDLTNNELDLTIAGIGCDDIGGCSLTYDLTPVADVTAYATPQIPTLVSETDGDVFIVFPDGSEYQIETLDFPDTDLRLDNPVVEIDNSITFDIIDAANGDALVGTINIPAANWTNDSSDSSVDISGAGTPGDPFDFSVTHTLEADGSWTLNDGTVVDPNSTSHDAPAGAFADIDRPTDTEAKTWGDANITEAEQRHGALVVYFVAGGGGSAIDPDFVWKYSEDETNTIILTRIYQRDYVSQTLYVSPIGTTGRRGYREYPYPDPWLAAAAASSGDTIHVSAGTYSVKTSGGDIVWDDDQTEATNVNLWAQPDINYYFEPGAVINIDTDDTDTMPLFINDSVAGTLNVKGDLEIQVISSSVRLIHDIVTTDNVIFFEAKKIQMLKGGLGGLYGDIIESVSNKKHIYIKEVDGMFAHGIIPAGSVDGQEHYQYDNVNLVETTGVGMDAVIRMALRNDYDNYRTNIKLGNVYLDNSNYSAPVQLLKFWGIVYRGFELLGDYNFKLDIDNFKTVHHTYSANPLISSSDELKNCKIHIKVDQLEASTRPILSDVSQASPVGSDPKYTNCEVVYEMNNATAAGGFTFEDVVFTNAEIIIKGNVHSLGTGSNAMIQIKNCTFVNSVFKIMGDFTTDLNRQVVRLEGITADSASRIELTGNFKTGTSGIIISDGTPLILKDATLINDGTVADIVSIGGAIDVIVESARTNVPIGTADINVTELGTAIVRDSNFV